MTTAALPERTVSTGSLSEKAAGRGSFVGSLESLRGLAALTVCLFHAADIQYAGTPILQQHAALRLVLNGHGAIILFFVLSGFVLRLSLDTAAGTSNTLLSLKFVTARLFRLYPVVIATTAVFVCAAPFVYNAQFALGDAIRNALLLDTKIVGAFWTLQIELFGSALVLIAFLLERRFGVWSVVILTAAILPLSFVGTRAVIAGPVHAGYFYIFLCGYLMALLPQKSGTSSWRLALLLCAGVTAFYGAHAYGYVLKQGLLLITTVGASIVVYVLSRHDFEKSLDWAPLRLLGRLSYSFYALHQLGVDIAQRLANSAAFAGLPHWMVTASLMSFVVVVAIVLAVPMNYFIERPGIAAGRRLFEAFFSPARKLT